MKPLVRQADTTLKCRTKWKRAEDDKFANGITAYISAPNCGYRAGMAELCIGMFNSFQEVLID